MNEIVNLNKARKDRERTEKKAEADLNARKFGRSKAERMVEAARNAQAKGLLDQQKFEEE